MTATRVLRPRQHWCSALVYAGCPFRCPRSEPYLGVLVRLAAGPPRELHDWAAVTIQRAHDRLYESLRAVLPDVPAAELRFRVKCASGIIVELGGWALEPDLRGKSPQQIEDLLVPVVAGALAGG